jgi:Tryptophan-associated transmembrane protein (Trp_oprn_chp)
MDASTPSSLRLAGFVCAMVGAILIGVGASTTWITVGFEGAGNANTVIPGTDLIDGVVALVCAVAVLVGILGTRIASRPRVRKVLAWIAIAAGFVAFAVGGAFLLVGTSRSAVTDAVGIPVSDVEAVGGFGEIGAGPYLVLLGGILAFVGGVLSLAWASRISAPDRGTARSSDDPTPAPS